MAHKPDFALKRYAGAAKAARRSDFPAGKYATSSK
jgi:hypothetical protein